jgi:hypothetical protein
MLARVIVYFCGCGVELLDGVDVSDGGVVAVAVGVGGQAGAAQPG